MCHSLSDFGELLPTRDRKQYLQALRSSEDEYFDEVAGHWTSDPHYLPDDANAMAQSLHRYRLITFSNFLTTVNSVQRFELNLHDVLQDAAQGTVLLVLNQYQGGMYISGVLTTTERTPRQLIALLGPTWVGTDSAV